MLHAGLYQGNWQFFSKTYVNIGTLTFNHIPPYNSSPPPPPPLKTSVRNLKITQLSFIRQIKSTQEMFSNDAFWLLQSILIKLKAHRQRTIARRNNHRRYTRVSEDHGLFFIIYFSFLSGPQNILVTLCWRRFLVWSVVELYSARNFKDDCIGIREYVDGPI